MKKPQISLEDRVKAIQAKLVDRAVESINVACSDYCADHKDQVCPSYFTSGRAEEDASSSNCRSPPNFLAPCRYPISVDHKKKVIHIYRACSAIGAGVVDGLIESLRSGWYRFSYEDNHSRLNLNFLKGGNKK